MVVRRPLLKPDDVERMITCGEIEPDSKVELVDGDLVSLTPASHYHARVCMQVGGTLLPFASRIGAALLDSSAGFRVGDGYRQVRSPDVSLGVKERNFILPSDRRIAAEAPDLAIEVLSPDQRTEAYARPKVAEYLAAGAGVVWLVDPEARTIRVYEPNREDFAVYSAETDQIAPGFLARIASFFP
jgi:Uma2 family endonuclease